MAISTNGKPCLIFDWSGVISNDFDVVVQTYNLLFSDYGAAPLTHDEFREHFELPYENFCRKYLGHDVALEELQDKFRQIYTLHKMTPTIIPGVETVLDTLHREGIYMSILSSHSFVSREAEHYFPGKNFFIKIFEDIPDKRHCIDVLLETLSFNPENTFYVGDMEHDIITGQQAGVKTIAVTTGYRSRALLSQYSPDYIFDSLDEILPLLAVC